MDPKLAPNRLALVSGGGPRRLAGLLLAALLCSGCAVHYHDKKTGTEHLWGFGHLKMRAVPQRGDQWPFTNAVVAVVTGVRMLGLNVGAGEDFAGLVTGWESRSRLVIKQEDSSFYLLWPTNAAWLPHPMKDLFRVRVGPEFPFTNGVLNQNTESPAPKR